MKQLLHTLSLPRVRPDTALLVALALIAGIGLVMVGSASVAVADRLTSDPMYFFYRQAIFALMGSWWPLWFCMCRCVSGRPIHSHCWARV